MKVYIVVRECEDGCEIKGVFGTRKAAEKELMYYMKQSMCHYSIIIEEVL